jgi:hypothetical protein
MFLESDFWILGLFLRFGGTKKRLQNDLLLIKTHFLTCLFEELLFFGQKKGCFNLL